MVSLSKFARSMGLAGAIACALAVPADAGCKRIGFSVNDYGKDGPSKDAQELLDKHIAKWAAEQGIEKYTVGKKDVSCELFLNLIVVDEHTCTATATVCWGGDKPPASGPQQAKSTPAKKDAAPKAAAAATEAPAADKAADKSADAAPADAAAADSKPADDKAADAKAETPAPGTGAALSAAVETGTLPLARGAETPSAPSAAAATPSTAPADGTAAAALAAAERAAAAAERAAAAAERAEAAINGYVASKANEPAAPAAQPAPAAQAVPQVPATADAASPVVAPVTPTP